MTEDSEMMIKDNKQEVKTGSGGSSAGDGAKSSSATKTSNTSGSIQKKDKTRDAPMTRVVIRHLPPTMTSDQFLEAISPVPDYNEYYFCRSDPSLGMFVFCRAYISFTEVEDVFVFKDKFDGYVFIDLKGNEFPAIVEFAPYQRNTRRRVGLNSQSRRRDNKVGTIEQDPDFLEFLELLEQMKNETNMPSADVYLEEIEARDKQLRANHGCLKMTTPLIEFIKNKKLEKNRLREERREERRVRREQEDQQKRLKLLKAKDDNKKYKESDESSKEKFSKENYRREVREDDKFKLKTKDSDKTKSEPKSSEYVKKFDKPLKGGRYRNRSDRYKDKDGGHSSKDNYNESTFVVKVVNSSGSDAKHQSTPSHSNDIKISDSTDNTNNGMTEEVSNSREEVPKENRSNESRSQRQSENTSKSYESSRDSRRVRNKDRPTREIYRPGATKRPETDGQSQPQSTSESSHNTDRPKQSTSGGGGSGHKSGGYKPRVYTRSKP